MWQENRVPNILVVDDDDDLRELFVLIIRSTGASVTSVGDGPSAVEALRETRYDILFTDFFLGGMTAEDVLARARQNCPSFAILVTGRSFDAIPRGFDLILKKPISEEEIHKALQFLWHPRPGPMAPA